MEIYYSINTTGHSKGLLYKEFQVTKTTKLMTLAHALGVEMRRRPNGRKLDSYFI